MSSRTRGDTAAAAAAGAGAGAVTAASLEKSLEGFGEEGDVFSPPRNRKNKGTSDNEVDLLENDFRKLSPAVTTTPRRGVNRKKSKKSVTVFRVGDMIDYWAAATTVHDPRNMRTGNITVIFSVEGWDESDNMHDIHLMVGTDPITYGSLIRPINTEKWITTCCRKSCQCVVGEMKGGLRASVGRLSNQFKGIDEAARTSFRYSPSESDISSDDDAGNRDALQPENLGTPTTPEKLATPTSTATLSPTFIPPLSLLDEVEGPAESFYNDQSKVPASSKTVTLMVLAVGVVDNFITTVVDDETTFTPPHPYSYFLSTKVPGFGKKSSLSRRKFLLLRSYIVIQRQKSRIKPKA